MKQVKEVTGVCWVSNKKDRVSCKFLYHDNTAEVLSVPRDDNNIHWQTITATWTLEKIDENTTNTLSGIERQKLAHIARKKEAVETKRASVLFNSKIEAFEIPEVIAAPKHMKAQIRKAATATHVLALVAICISEAMKKQQQAEENNTGGTNS